MSSAKKKRPKLGVRDSSPPFPFPRDPPPDLFPSKEEIVRLFAVVAIAASVAFACNKAVVFFNREPKHFCDSGELSQDPASEFCEPCPANGHCSSGQLECLHGYKKLGRKCIEDGEISQTAEKLTERVEDHICNAYAQVLCNEAGKIWFEEADIMRLLDEKKSRNNMGLKEDTYMLAKQKVMDTLRNSLEKRALINGSKEYKCPDTRAESYKPILCCVRQWIHGHIFSVVTSSTIFLGLMRFLWGVRQKKNLSARAEQLYEQVCEILEENASTIKSMNQDGEPWVVASWLRDHLLLPRERRDAKLWKKVEELLLEDSRIDQYPKLVKGESKVVLEWQVDSSLSSKMRQKRAISKSKPGSRMGISSSYQEMKSTVNASLIS